MKTIPVSATRLRDLANKYGTPLQLYDEQGIRRNARALVSKLEGKFPQGFTQFFAVKALPNPAILAALIDEGCGLDCSSTAELRVAAELGVPGDRIMYTSNYTSPEDLKLAYDQGVIMNLDDVSLVDSVVGVAGRTPELICFRLNPGIGRTDSETKSNVLGGPEAKFGVPLEDIVRAYALAKKHGSSRFGIHMMTGSCVMKSAYWRETVKILIDVMVKLRKELDIEFEFVNIGGGLGIPYKPDELPIDLDETISGISSTFFDSLPKEVSPPKLYMENGRYMTGPFGYLVSECKAIKNAFGSTFYGLDSAMHCLMRPGMYGSYHYISVPEALERNPNAPTKKANVVGTLCENNDWFAKDRELSSAIRLNDLFVIHDTGAHSLSMGFNYNSKLKPPEVLLRGENCEADCLIRERETYETLVYNTHMPSDLLPNNSTRSEWIEDNTKSLKRRKRA